VTRVTDPHMAELEQSVLGAVLLHPGVLDELADLEVGDFHDLRAQAVWGAIRQLEAAGQPVDAVTIGSELEAKGRLDAVGWDYLGQVALRVPTPDNAVEYARRVRADGLRRRLAAVLHECEQMARSPEHDPEDVISTTQAGLAELGKAQASAGRSIGDAVIARWGRIEAIARARADGSLAMSGYPTGVAGLDDLTGGWQPGIVSIVCARPGMGKSSLAMATAFACSKGGHGVHVFSLEDSEESYADRLLSRLSRIPSSQLRSARLDNSEVGRVISAVSTLRAEKRWQIDETAGISAEMAVRRMRACKRRMDTRVAILDYATLLSRQRGESPHEAASRSMITLAASAKHDRIAWVVLAQLNRDVEKRPDKRPVLSDLRESGSFEEMSKMVVALYRGAYYGGNPRPGIDYAEGQYAPSHDEWQRQVQLLVLKNSNGPTDTVIARWDGPTTTIW
jgi:replicative DNA helicase